MRTRMGVPKLLAIGALLPLVVGTADASLISKEVASARGFIDVAPMDGLFTDGRSGSNGEVASYVLAGNVSGWAMRTALEFDISDIPSNSTVSNAYLTLNFHVSTARESLTDIELHGFTGNGRAESADVRVDNLLAMFQLPYQWALPPIEVNADVTPFVQSIVDDTSNFVGLSLRIANDLSPSFDASVFFSAQPAPEPNYDPDMGMGPVLTIEYSAATSAIPEPSTLAIWCLIGLTVGGIRLCRRRRIA